MSTKEFLKKETAIEREKLKQMSWRDKMWYISEYYKFHIFGVIMVFIILYVIGSSIYRSTFDTALYCMYINNNTGTEVNTEPLTKDFYEYMEFNDKQTVITESAFVSYGDNVNDLSYASMTKISALVASHELDIMICDTGTLEHYGKLSGFMNLEEVLPADLLELVRDRLIYIKDDTGASYAGGVDLGGTSFAEDSLLGMDPPILASVSTSQNINSTIGLLRYIFT